MIQYLEWDSSFLGCKVGKIDLKDRLFDRSKFNKINDYDLIYIFSDHEIENNDLNRAYIRVTYEFVVKKITQEYLDDNNICLISENQISEEYEKKLIDLAFESGKFSRFKLDKNFDRSIYYKLYKKWIENSLKGKFADAVYVRKDEKTMINGFVTISHHSITSKIGLIAVEKKARGQGVGSKLIQVSKKAALENGSEKLLVSTQYENERARNFYLNNGFKEKEIVYIYHLWNN